MAITFVGAGTGVGSAASSFTVSSNASTQVGDLMILFVEDTGNFTSITNWTMIDGSGSSGTICWAYWKFATSAAETVSVPNTDTVTYNHRYGVIATFRGVDSTTPIHGYAMSNVSSGAPSTSVTFPSKTTTINNTMIVNAMSYDTDTTTPQFTLGSNASLTSLTKQFDGATSVGDGGGIAICTGFLATAGASGSTTGTLSTSSAQAKFAIALAPAASAAYLQTLILSI